MKHISSKDNSTVKHIAKLMKSSSYRKENNQFVIEGVRLCTDALDSNVEISVAVFSEQAFEKHNELVNRMVGICESTFVFSDKLFSQISDTKSPQGILCVCSENSRNFNIQQDSVYIALERIQDPSNMGTILRTAEALGVKGVVITEDCCDVFSPKVIRGTMGAVFRLPIKVCGNIADMVEIFNSQNITTIAAVVDKNAVDVTNINPAEKKNCAIFIGNEGNGLEQTTIEKCRIKATIPMLGRAESLNASVASAIMMWEMLRGCKQWKIH
ncbi:MAG: RNA methyltransferase [Acutalibacteraceae bacterium]|nr:RNA methyltransferase [Acutalibacteraceae bacterium]